MISIAVLGYGTVGSGVVEVLEKNKDVINQRAGDEISIVLSRNEETITLFPSTENIF